MGVTCLLSCIWEPVQAALLSCLGTAVADSLSSLQNWVVSEVKTLIFFWRNQVEQVPISWAYLAGVEEIGGYLQKIGGYLKDDKVGVIGVYGKGGVGKTTLLAMINNEFRRIGAPEFKVVIWVTVSKDPSILKIQKSIGDRLGLSLSAGGEVTSSQAEEQARAIIFKALSQRRFLLLLDDIWEELELNLVGIPHPTTENKCKIILTTRSKEVCTKMRAKRIVDVGVLNESESWKLFKESVGTEVDLDSPVINPHAKAVADKCGGLPLALITVGHAMAESKSVEEWKEALEQLRESPHKLPGMKDKVLSLLKFSFDRLGDENTKECLLYCCLFPEDYEIPIPRLIEYWVGEGFLGNGKSESIFRARNRGYGVITKLKSACLLETTEDLFCSGEPQVKMHDVVREMCLWLTGGDFDKNNTFLVREGVGLWGDAKRISLMDHKLESLPQNVPSCPKLQTLLAYSCYFYEIRGGIFECMAALLVLDLSNTNLSMLPEKIGFLAELRYLNLSCTTITSLPEGLGMLAKLRQLNLRKTSQLQHIPQGVWATLTGLQTLGLRGSAIWKFNELSGSDGDNSETEEKAASPSSVLVSLSCCQKLEELSLSVFPGARSLETLLKCDKLARCTIDLKLSPFLGFDLNIIFRRLEKLRIFCLDCSYEETQELVFDSTSECSSLEELKLRSLSKITVVGTSPCLFSGLRLLHIECCNEIHDLTWVRQLPCLEVIGVYDCEGVEELLSTVDGGSGDHEAHDCDYSSSLPMLKRMILDYLPSLKSISDRPLLLPSLEYLDVIHCHQLEKLPFGPRSAKSIQTIKAEEEWWEGLEWYHDEHGQSIKPRFLPYLRFYQ